MINEVEVYRTNDNKDHSSISKAEEHILNKVAEILDKSLDKQSLNLTASDIFKVVDMLTKDIKTIKELHEKLSYWLD